jgi:DNA-binding response OmpR family regulator
MAEWTVLIVAGDPCTRAFLSTVLTVEGIASVAVPSGEAALHAIAADPPDLVVLARDLPGLGGAEVARQIQARGGPVPIVLRLAEGVPARAARELNAVAYVRTPVELGAFLAVIERCRPPTA